MKLLIALMLVLTSIIGYSQNSFPGGIYISELGDIIIRNDSVISEGVSYYVFYFISDESVMDGLTVVSYVSEDKMQKLEVVFKSGTPRHLMFNYKNYFEESFNVAFISGE